MRTSALVLALTALALAEERVAPVSAVPDGDAARAISEFDKAFLAKAIEERQGAVYSLHGFPHDAVLAKLAQLLKNRDDAIKSVAALAIGGQAHNVPKAGDILMKSFRANYRTDEVVASTMDAMGELRYMGYWPELAKCFEDDRALVAVRALDLVGANKDWRAWEELLKLYKEQIAKGYSWETGEVNVDTGADGDVDQKAAEAAFNAKYGEGGSKAKAAATGKAGSRREINLSTQLRRTVKLLTGQDFDTALAFEDYVLENYLEIARKVAVLEGKDPEAAAKRAAADLPARKKQVEEERDKLAKQAEENRKKRDAANK